jgi:hypothetical protein
MNRNLKWSILKLAVILAAVGAFCTGCFFWGGDDHDHGPDHHDDHDYHDDHN